MDSTEDQEIEAFILKEINQYAAQRHFRPGAKNRRLILRLRKGAVGKEVMQRGRVGRSITLVEKITPPKTVTTPKQAAKWISEVAVKLLSLNSF